MSAASELIFRAASSAVSASSPPTHDDAALAALEPVQLGAIFVLAMYLVSVSEALVQRRWMITRGRDELQPRFAAFVAIAWQRELRPIAFLAPLYEDATLVRIALIAEVGRRLARQAVESARRLDDPSYRALVRTMVQDMAVLARFEESLASQRAVEDVLLPNQLARAFDEVDDVLQLGYEGDRAMQRNGTAERLYEGSGASVQTSYATILLLLETLAPARGAHIVDLGSGFGRFGLTAGLWRADLALTGFEYVRHRVDSAQAAAHRAGIGDRVRFTQQDLAAPAFEIPVADAYYLYDPFSDATYRRVLARLCEIGRRHAITVITKGKAGGLLADAVTNAGWTRPVLYDLGNLMLIRSREA